MVRGTVMAEAMYRLPFEDDGDWSTSRTNWDDPSGKHHPVSQAYAYDFRHDIGGKVRAARGGEVISMRSTITINNHDLPDDHPMKNKNPGGNWVLIRHIDDTVAHYYHLNTGEVFVEKGDVVMQGQLIARSGNTGRSTGPHLHFHVTSFWDEDDDKGGPTIPVFFEDRDHDSFRPVRDGDLASNNVYLRQENWRRCVKCQGLFFAGGNSRCPKGDEHSADEAHNFVLRLNTGKAYFFKGDTYSRYDISGDAVEPGYPAQISKFWPGVWDDIDAAIVWNNGKVYFFKGERYLRYDISDDRVDAGYPKNISQHWPGMFEDDIDAAVMWNNGKAYFFKGEWYVRYDLGDDRVDPGYPKRISQFWTLLWTSDIDAALTWNNGKAYFFKDDRYIRYDLDEDRADSGFPARIERFWSGLDDDLDAAVLWPDVGDREWRRCSKCAGLFSRSRGTSKCAAGGAHEKAGKAQFSLPKNSADNAAQNWRLCQQCAVVFSPTEGESACPNGGKHQATGGSLSLTKVVTEVAQKGWRRCAKCRALFRKSSAGAICSGGGMHESTGGYLVLMNFRHAPGQQGWRRCSKCDVLFFVSNQNSRCAAGQRHKAMLANYSLIANVLSLLGAPGEWGWAQCSKCAALFHGGPSTCPAGGPHVPLGLPNFAVMED